MSQSRDSRSFDIVVILIFVAVVGYLASRSHAPKETSIPGAYWPEAPIAVEPEFSDFASDFDDEELVDETADGADEVELELDVSVDDEGDWD